MCPGIIWSIKSIECINRMRSCFFLLKMRHYFPTSFMFEKYYPENKNLNGYCKYNKMPDNCFCDFSKIIFGESLMQPLRFFEFPMKGKTTYQAAKWDYWKNKSSFLMWNARKYAQVSCYKYEKVRRFSTIFQP